MKLKSTDSPQSFSFVEMLISNNLPIYQKEIIIIKQTRVQMLLISALLISEILAIEIFGLISSYLLVKEFHITLRRRFVPKSIQI